MSLRSVKVDVPNPQQAKNDWNLKERKYFRIGTVSRSISIFLLYTFECVSSVQDYYNIEEKCHGTYSNSTSTHLRSGFSLWNFHYPRLCMFFFPCAYYFYFPFHSIFVLPIYQVFLVLMCSHYNCPERTLCDPSFSFCNSVPTYKAK